MQSLHNSRLACASPQGALPLCFTLLLPQTHSLIPSESVHRAACVNSINLSGRCRLYCSDALKYTEFIITEMDLSSRESQVPINKTEMRSIDGLGVPTTNPDCTFKVKSSCWLDFYKRHHSFYDSVEGFYCLVFLGKRKMTNATHCDVNVLSFIMG